MIHVVCSEACRRWQIPCPYTQTIFTKAFTPANSWADFRSVEFRTTTVIKNNFAVSNFADFEDGSLETNKAFQFPNQQTRMCNNFISNK